MNVHTVEIGHPIGPHMIRSFCRSQRWFKFPQRDKKNRICHNIVDFINANEGTVAAQPDILTSGMYPADGIQKVTLLRNPSLQGYFYLVVVVNLESLYRQSVTVETFASFTDERLQGCSREFDWIMAEHSGIKLKTLLEWSARRVDYAVDVRFECPELVPLYILLMQRGRILRGMVQRDRYEGSYYLESLHGDVTINFYDKVAQLRNDRYLCGDDRLLRQAKGLLRLEVQCQGRKLDHIRDLIRERNLPHYGMKLRTFLNSEISNIIVQYYYSIAIGYFDYHSLQAAETRLNEQRGRQDMKLRILQFLQQVTLTGSISAAIEAYRQGVMPDGREALIGGSNGTLQNILNEYLPRYGLNPVLLPEEYPKSTLPNAMPMDLRLGCQKGCDLDGDFI